MSSNIVRHRSGSPDAPGNRGGPDEFRHAGDYRGEGGDFITHADIADFVRKYSRTMLVSALLMVAVAGVYAYTRQPIYAAQARLLLDPDLKAEMPKGMLDVDISIDTTYVQSQIVVLQSEKILSSVVRKLELEQKPEFQSQKPSLLARLRGMVWGGSELAEAPSELQMASAATAREHAAVNVLRSNLDVKRVGLTYAIDIGYSSQDAKLAADIANAVSRAYIADQISTRVDAARQGGQWLEQRIDELRKQMNASARKVQKFKSALDFRIDDAVPGKAGQTSRQQESGTLEELESEANTYRKIYETFLLAYTQTVQRQSNPFSHARFLTEAWKPLSPSWPRKGLLLALGGFFGLLLGFGISLARHLMDATARTANDLRTQLGLECIAAIPRASHAETRLGEHPFSPYANSLKQLAKHIVRRKQDDHCLVLGIASAAVGEGKTTTAENLAVLLRMQHRPVLLIDANLDNRSLSRHRAKGVRRGLIEALETGERISEAILAGSNVEPDLLPLTPNRQMFVGLQLIGSQNMALLLDQLRHIYDFIIVDLPAVMPIVEAVEIASLLDETVLVVEAGRTPVASIVQAVSLFDAAGVELMGAVLSKKVR